LLKRLNTKLKRRDNRIVDRLFVPDEFTQEVFKGRSLLRFRRGHVHVRRGSGGRRKKLDAGVHRRVQLRDLLDVVRVDELNWNVFRDDVAVFVEEVLLFFFFFDVVVFVVRVRVVVVALRNVLSLVRSDGDRNVRRGCRFHFAHAFRDRHLRRGESETLVVPSKVVRAVDFQVTVGAQERAIFVADHGDRVRLADIARHRLRVLLRDFRRAFLRRVAFLRLDASVARRFVSAPNDVRRLLRANFTL